MTLIQVCRLLQNRNNTNGTYNSVSDLLLLLSVEFVNLELVCLICGELVLLSKVSGISFNSNYSVKVKKTEHRIIFMGLLPRFVKLSRKSLNVEKI